jgi:hypothetical protein
VAPSARGRDATYAPAVTFLAIVFAISALVLFILAFNRVLAGRIGVAVVTGLLAVVMSGVAATLAL